MQSSGMRQTSWVTSLPMLEAFFLGLKLNKFKIKHLTRFVEYFSLITC